MYGSVTSHLIVVIIIIIIIIIIDQQATIQSYSFVSPVTYQYSKTRDTL